MPNTTRIAFAAVAAVVAALYGYALYTQHVGGLEPCPLCLAQRVFYAVVGLVAVAGAVHGPGPAGRRLYGSLIAVAALAGAAVAGRQVWLQHLPPERVPACGPSLEYMLETMPFGAVLQRLIQGDGNCALVDWTFAGLSMAEWSLIWLLLLALAGGWLAVSRRLGRSD